MNFDWSQYFDLAQELARTSPRAVTREARLRSAISRAYYAVFCLARNHVRDQEGLSIPREKVHSYVTNQFKDSPDSTHSQFGHDLDRLRWDRNKADYDDSFPRLDHIATLDMLLAEQLLNTLAMM
jgi:hypothetical protein